MIYIVKEFNNGIEDCLVIDSSSNKKILELTNSVLWNGEISIVKRRLNDYVESIIDREIEVEGIE